MGAKAVECIREGQTNKMVAIQKGELITVEFPDTSQPTKWVEDVQLLQLNEILCEMDVG